MDYLWTPWRYQYITGQAKPDGCIFCAAGASTDDRAHLVVYRGAHAYVILNRFPYTSGHVMIVPYAHVATMLDLPEEALAEMMRLARDAERHLRAVYRPDGLNLGMNLGESAASARPAALDGRYQLHDGDRRDPRAAGGSGSHLASPARRLRRR